MEAKELMIGDLLRVTKDVCIKKGTIVRVRAIDADDSLPQKGLKCAVRCLPIDDIYGMNIGGVWLNFLEPISLTAEILEKNGFVGDKEVMQYDFTEDGQKYHFSLRQMYDKDDNPKGYSFFAFNVLTIIDYVHQLQHALKLCGIDKQIVL